MEVIIKTIKEKKLIGLNLEMSLANNKTGLLWQSFMPRRHEIENKITNDLISLQVYNEAVRFGDFTQSFTKWAIQEVGSIDNIPDGMSSFILESGLYAKFNYKGLNTDPSVFIYIYTDWLPKSNYILDNRPSFEILEEKYKNGDPNSEEIICIPIKEKQI